MLEAEKKKATEDLSKKLAEAETDEERERIQTEMNVLRAYLDKKI